MPSNIRLTALLDAAAEGRYRPSAAVMEAAADDYLLGPASPTGRRWDASKTCPDCHLALTAIGTCSGGCDD